MGEWGDTPHAKLQSPRYVASPSMDLLDFPSSKMSLSSYIGRRERWISAGEERHNNYNLVVYPAQEQPIKNLAAYALPPEGHSA